MMLFVLGLACGGMTVFAVLAWWGHTSGGDVAAFRARRDLADLERSTMQRMLEVALAARRQPAGSTARGYEVIDGTASDVDAP